MAIQKMRINQRTSSGYDTLYPQTTADMVLDEASGKTVANHIHDYVKHPGIATTTNSGNAYTVTLSPAPTSYVNGMGLVVTANADATGDTKELAKLLGEFYAYIANGEELTWEGVQEAAQGAADWLWNNRKQTTDEYSAEILRDLRTRGVSFNEDQKSEAAVTHDTFANYRKALFGSVKITENGMPLDDAWQELSAHYPGVFPEDTNSGDMPRANAIIGAPEEFLLQKSTYLFRDE